MADELLPIPVVPDGLREAAQLGKLVPFIGAGASLLAGCPSWAEFADAALKSLIRDGRFTYSQLDQIRHLHPRVKLSLARSIALEKGGTIDFRPLLHPTPRRDHKNGCRLYRSLFTLAKIFVTTNYDEWLDEQIPEPTPAASPATSPTSTPPVKPLQVIYKVDDLLPSLLSQSNTVIHLHGSLRDPAGMILTTRDYVRHYANDRLNVWSLGRAPLRVSRTSYSSRSVPVSVSSSKFTTGEDTVGHSRCLPNERQRIIILRNVLFSVPSHDPVVAAPQA